MTQPQGAGSGVNQDNTATNGAISIGHVGPGDQTVIFPGAIFPVAEPSRRRFRRGFGWALLVLLAVDVLFAVIMWATGAQYTGVWQSVATLLVMLTVLTALLWLRLTRRVLGGLLRAVLGLFGKKADRAVDALAGFLSTSRR